MSFRESFSLNGKAFQKGVGRIGQNREFNGTTFTFAPEDKGRIVKITLVRAGADSLKNSRLEEGTGYIFNGTSVRLVNPGVNFFLIEGERESTQDEFLEATKNAPILRDIQALNIFQASGGSEVATVKVEQIKNSVMKSSFFQNPGEKVSGFLNFGVTSKPSKDFVKSPMPVILQEDAGDGSATASSPNASNLVKLLKKKMNSTNLNKVDICNGTLDDIQKSLTKNTPGLKPTARKNLLSKNFMPATVSVKVLAKVEEAVADKEEGKSPEDIIGAKQKEVTKARAQLFSNCAFDLGKIGDLIPQAGRSFANIQPNMLATAKGIPCSTDINKAISNIPDGVKIPTAQKGQVVEKLMKGQDAITGKVDYSTNMNKALGKGTLTPDMTPVVGKEEQSAATSKSTFNGFLTPDDYVFETIGSFDKLLDYLQGSVRCNTKGPQAITQMIVDFTTDEYIFAKDAKGLQKLNKEFDLEFQINQQKGKKTPTEASAAARKILETEGTTKKFGIQAHFVIKRDGTIQKGRPIDETNDDSSFPERFDKMIYVVLIAGEKNPVTPQQAASTDHVISAAMIAMPQIYALGVNETDPNYVGPGIDISAIRAKYNKIVADGLATFDPGNKTREELAVVKSPEFVKTVSTKLNDVQKVNPSKITKEYEGIDEATGLKKPVNIDEATADMKSKLKEIKSGNIDVQGELTAAQTKGRGEAAKILGDKNANALFDKLDGSMGGVDSLIKDLNINKIDDLTDNIKDAFGV
tara:strand:- start:2253 stop:4505 length:2253 start_codon:yes stop_codon:yes gene_type:complete